MLFRKRGWTSSGSKPSKGVRLNTDTINHLLKVTEWAVFQPALNTLLFLQCGGLVAALWSGLKKVVVENTSAQVCDSTYFSLLHICVLGAANKLFFLW